MCVCFFFVKFLVIVVGCFAGWLLQVFFYFVSESHSIYFFSLNFFCSVYIVCIVFAKSIFQFHSLAVSRSSFSVNLFLFVLLYHFLHCFCVRGVGRLFFTSYILYYFIFFISPLAHFPSPHTTRWPIELAKNQMAMMATTTTEEKKPQANGFIFYIVCYCFSVYIQST